MAVPQSDFSAVRYTSVFGINALQPLIYDPFFNNLSIYGITGITNTITDATGDQLPTALAVKTYVDYYIQGLHWIDPCINLYDNTSGLPPSPSDYDRWIAMATAHGWVINRIYEWVIDTWTEYIPKDYDSLLLIVPNYIVTFNGINWIQVASGTATSFLSLTDTPHSYTGSYQLVQINSTNDGLAFAPITMTYTTNTLLSFTNGSSTWNLLGSATTPTNPLDLISKSYWDTRINQAVLTTSSPSFVGVRSDNFSPNAQGSSGSTGNWLRCFSAGASSLTFGQTTLILKTQGDSISGTVGSHMEIDFSNTFGDSFFPTSISTRWIRDFGDLKVQIWYEARVGYPRTIWVYVLSNAFTLQNYITAEAHGSLAYDFINGNGIPSTWTICGNSSNPVDPLWQGGQTVYYDSTQPITYPSTANSTIGSVTLQKSGPATSTSGGGSVISAGGLSVAQGMDSYIGGKIWMGNYTDDPLSTSENKQIWFVDSGGGDASIAFFTNALGNGDRLQLLAEGYNANIQLSASRLYLSAVSFVECSAPLTITSGSCTAPSYVCNGTTDATALGLGSFTTLGGASFAKQIRVGTNATITGTVTAGSLSLTTPYNPFNQSLNTTDSPSFAGITNIGPGNINLSGNILMGSHSITGGALTMNATIQFTSTGANNTVFSTVDSSSPTTGAWQVRGGVVAQKQIRCGTVLTCYGTTGTNLVVSSTDNATSKITGCATLAGGIGISGDAWANNFFTTGSYTSGATYGTAHAFQYSETGIGGNWTGPYVGNSQPGWGTTPGGIVDQCKLTRVGRNVTIQLIQQSVTANATAIATFGATIPTGFRPLNNLLIPYSNGVTTLAMMSIDTSGTITCTLDGTGASFPNGSTVYVGGISASYYSDA
jgi:hypothetical protein